MTRPTAGPWPPPGTPDWTAPYRRRRCRPKPPISTSSARAGAEGALEVWPCMHHSRLVMAALLPEDAEAADCEMPRFIRRAADGRLIDGPERLSVLP